MTTVFGFWRSNFYSRCSIISNEGDPKEFSMFLCDCQVISVKKLQLVKRLHISEQSWFKTAEHCSLYLASKVALQLLCHSGHFLCLCGKKALCDYPSLGHRGPECHRGVYWPLETAADCFHDPGEEDWACSVRAAQCHPARHCQMAELLHHTETVRTS